MSNEKNENLDKNIVENKLLEKKLIYEKPEIESEDLTSFGAVCNGTSGPAAGRRKSSTGRPERCKASRINS